MIKIDPIIAVKDIAVSSIWYQAVLGCRSLHGGKDFDILVDENDEVLLCLHKWEEHDHPTMANPKIEPGNGLILYFRTNEMQAIWQNVASKDFPVEKGIHLNPNSTKKEFSLRDPDGYYLTITEYHNYDG
jgi:hypothetical protein